MSSLDAILSPRLSPGFNAAPPRGARRRLVASPWRLLERGRGGLGAILLGAAMLIAVTVLNGRPTVFTDTDDYFSQGKDVARAAELWLAKGVAPIKLDEVGDRLHDPGDQDEEPVHNQNGARSVYYGLFVYGFERWGTLWALAGAQAVLAASVVYALWRKLAPGAAGGSYLQVMAALTLGSSLPVFTGFAMPDLFAGFAAAASVLLVLYADRLRWPGRLAAWALLAAAVNFHGSNLLTSAGVTALALGWLALRRTPWRSLLARAGAVLAAVAVAVMASQAYGLAIKLRTGDDLGRPPFLTARVLADGPGRDFLRRSCAGGARWTLCAYQADPLDKTEDILWSDDPATGIFNSAEYHTRVKLEREEHAFVLQAVTAEPLREAAAMLANWGRQLLAFGYDEPLRDPAFYLADGYWKTTTLRPLLLRERPCDPEAGACILHLPAGFLSELDAAFAVAALAWMVWTLAGEALARRRASLDEAALRTRAAAVLLVAAVALNAAVCGMLSGPFDRYEARLLWLVPCAALLLHVARRREARP